MEKIIQSDEREPEKKHRLYSDGTKFRPTFRGYERLILVMSVLDTLLIGTTLFMGGFSIQYAFSGIWHCYPWKNRQAEIIANHLDHIGIFVMITGSYMIPCAIILSETGLYLALGLWFGSLVGSANCLGILGNRYGATSLTSIYVAMGSLCLFSIHEMLETMTFEELTYGLFSLIFYLLGALVYVFKYPDPIPIHWGYHEVFHLLCCAASTCTYMSNYSLIFRYNAYLENNFDKEPQIRDKSSDLEYTQ